MAKPKKIIVKESEKELKKLMKKVPSYKVPRIMMLLVLKRHPEGISKIKLAEAVGAAPNSVQAWRKKYEIGGLQALLTYRPKGHRKSVISAEEYQVLREKLYDAENNLQGYKELHQWFEQVTGRKINYSTLVAYCKRHFGTKIKVARKSHIKKSPKAVEEFKKKLVPTVKKR